MSTVRVHAAGRVRELVLADENTRNALSADTVADLDRQIRSVGEDPGVGAVLIRGDGAGFSSGANRHEVGRGRQQAGRPDFALRGMSPMFTLRETIHHSPVPVIAAVHGFAVGGGFALALACDLVTAAEDAQFWLPEVADGLLPVGPLAELVDLVGRFVALDILISGERLTASAARAAGLVNRIYPHDEFLAGSRDFATAIAGLDRTTTGLTKRLLRRAAHPHRSEVLSAATDAYTISKLLTHIR